MINYMYTKGICPQCGNPLKDGKIDIKVAVPGSLGTPGIYVLEYTYTCDVCWNEIMVEREVVPVHESELAQVAGEVAEMVREVVESNDK